MAYEQLFNNLARHIRLDTAELDYFCSILKLRRIRKRQYLLQAGDVCRFETYVLKGCVRVFYVDAQGLEHIVMFGAEDWWVSDMESLRRQTPATMHIEALEDTEVLQISQHDMEDLLLRVPKFERYFRIMLQNAFIAHQQRILNNISLTAENRYALFLEKYPHFAQRLPQKQIALYLGITPEFLSKVRKQLASGK